jgi:ABC-type sugar transport system permease subunit
VAAAEPYWFVLPTLVVVFAVILYPVFDSLVISLQKYNLTQPTNRPFVGLDNYAALVASRAFWQVIGRTAVFTVFSVTATMLIGFAVALLLNEPFIGRGLVRGLLLIPWALPPVVVGMIWEWIYNGNYGILNAVLVTLHLTGGYISFLGDPRLAMPAVIVTKVWKEVPFVALLLLAGLQTIPAELYEAARLDGANSLMALVKITLPLLSPVLTVATVLQTMWSFRVFDIVYVMTSGGPADATNVIALQTYFESFQYYRFGSGAAMSYIVTLFLAGLSLVYMRLIVRDTGV